MYQERSSLANAKTTEIDDAIGREPYSTSTTSSTKPTSPMAASALKNPRNGGRRSGQRGWSGSSDYPVVNGAPPKCIKHADGCRFSQEPEPLQEPLQCVWREFW